MGICKEKTNIKARGIKKSKSQKPWFDNECRKVRDSYYRMENEIKSNNNNVRLDKIRIRAASKKLKENIKKKKVDYYRALQRKIRIFISHNSKEY